MVKVCFCNGGGCPGGGDVVDEAADDEAALLALASKRSNGSPVEERGVVAKGEMSSGAGELLRE